MCSCLFTFKRPFPPPSTQDEVKSTWSPFFTKAIEQGEPSRIEQLWQASRTVVKAKPFDPNTFDLGRINLSYQFGASVMQTPPSSHPVKAPRRSQSIAMNLLSKIWFNTLRVFTFEHHIQELGNRSFFDLTRYMRKLPYLPTLLGMTLLNQQAISFVAQTLAISSMLAHVIVVAITLSVTITALHFIQRYAIHALKRPLNELNPLDKTINLTQKALEEIPLSEIGREVDLDTLETAIVPSSCIVGLIGEAGTGKSEMARLLAHRIASGRCCETLRGKQMYLVNGASVKQAYIEKLKEHLKGHEEDVILCIDEADGVFNSKSATLLKSIWGHPAPRILLITTSLKYQQTFEAEEDGSWSSRIQPCLTLKPIDEKALLPILCQRLQRQLPWIQITPNLVQPFAKSGSLRDAIKRVDSFAAYKTHSYHSSQLLIDLKRRLQGLRTEQTDLAIGLSGAELIANERFQSLCVAIKEVSEQIAQEEARLEQLRQRLKRYQSHIELEAQWSKRTYEHWKKTQTDPSPIHNRMMIASAMWATDAFKIVAQSLREGLDVQLSQEEIRRWLASFPQTLAPAPVCRKQAPRIHQSRPPTHQVKSPQKKIQAEESDRSGSDENQVDEIAQGPSGQSSPTPDNKHDALTVSD